LLWENRSSSLSVTLEDRVRLEHNFHQDDDCWRAFRAKLIAQVKNTYLLVDKTMTKSSITAIDEQLVVGSLFSKALNKVVDTPNKSSKEAKQTKAPLFFYDFNVIPPVEELGSWKRTMLLLCGRISSHPLFFRPPCHPHLSTKLLGLIIFPTWSQVVC
jgi:hypothetical protein